MNALSRWKGVQFDLESIQDFQHGRKTQTRRVMDPQPPPGFVPFGIHLDAGKRLVEAVWVTLRHTVAYADELDRLTGADCWRLASRYGFPGDGIYVKEACFPWQDAAGQEQFLWRNSPESLLRRYTEQHGGDTPVKWRSPRHMPKRAARTFLEVVTIRSERLQDITPADCEREGIQWAPGQEWTAAPARGLENAYRSLYADHWDRLNRKRGYGWDRNPAVWVITVEPLSVTLPEYPLHGYVPQTTLRSRARMTLAG